MMQFETPSQTVTACGESCVSQLIQSYDSDKFINVFISEIELQVGRLSVSNFW